MSRNTMSFALPESLRDYIDARVRVGNYGNTSEYLRELIRRDQHEQSAQHLRDLIAARLPSLSVGDPDLIIRTGGEQRLSNFLLYGAAYAELAFTDTLWPDFTEDDLFGAISSYQRRERRFGNVGKPLAPSAAPTSDTTRS